MNRQLAAIVAGLESATARLGALRQALSPYDWERRPAPERWSPIECVAHLNLTSRAMLPLLRAGLVEARRRRRRAPRRYRRDLAGWLLTRALSTPGRYRTKTTPAFVPSGGRAVSEILEEFDWLQAQQIACVRDADGLAVQRVKIASPFNARVRYSVYSAMAILPIHQHRHLWQAEHG